MAEGNTDTEKLVQNEASKLDDFEENKKDSIDCLVGAQENERGEGENANAPDVNSNNLAVRLAKAKKNRNRHRKRRNKLNSKDGLTSSNESNDTLAGTDTDDASNVAATGLDSSVNEAPESNYEIKHIVLGSNSNTIIECSPEESEGAIQIVLQNQISATELNDMNGSSDDTTPVVISSSVTDTAREDSQLGELICKSSDDFVQENNFEMKEVVVVSSSNEFQDCVASQEDPVEFLQDQSSSTEFHGIITELSNDEYESCTTSSAVNVIFQSEGADSNEIENVESEDYVLSNLTEEDAAAMDKLNREWDNYAPQEDYLNNTIWSNDIKPELIDSEQGFVPQIKTKYFAGSNLIASPSSSSHMHLRVPNPSIECLGSDELTNSSTSTSGHQSLFRRESEQISSIAPFNTADVNEILQLACIKVEKEQGIKSDPTQWGSVSVNAEAQHSISTETQDEHQGGNETVVEVHELEPDQQEITLETEGCKLSTKISKNGNLDNQNKRADEGISEHELLIDMGQDSNPEVNAINQSSVDSPSEDDFMDRLVKGNSSLALIESTTQEDNDGSLLPISVASDTSNEQICPTSSSVNVLYLAEDATLLDENETGPLVDHVYPRTITPEVEVVLNREPETYSIITYEDRLNNNYWPPDAKSEVNQQGETENLNLLAAVNSSAAAIEEIRPSTSLKIGGDGKSKPSLNVWCVDSSVVTQAIAQASTENTENQDVDKEGKRWSWKNLLPCMSTKPRSKSKERVRANSDANLDVEGKRKKRGSSLPRFLEKKKTDKSKLKISGIPTVPPP